MFSARSFLPLRCLLVALLITVCIGAHGADSRRPRRRPQPKPITGDEYQLVFLGPAGAVLFNLVVDTGKRTIADTRRDYAAVVFRTLDADSSEALEPAEAAKIPQNGQLSAGAPQLGDGWKALDTNPADEQISPDELCAYVDQQLGPRLRVTLRTRLQQSVRLFGPLDANGDEHVSREEIELGLGNLHINDFDDDGTLSVAELQPYPTAMRQAIQQQEAENSGDVPLEALTSDAERAAACERLLNFYGASAGGSHSKTVPCARIGGMAEEDVEEYDHDADGHLSVDELAALLASDAPRLTIGAKVHRNAVQDADKVIDNLVEHATRTSGLAKSVQFRLGGMPVTVRASSNRYAGMSDPELIVNQTLVRFIELDADKNRYLDSTEFASLRARLPELGLPDVEFASVDEDGDGMVMHRELRAFAESNVGLTEAALEVTVSDDAKTLFEILDGNLDNRLSPREFEEGFTRMRRYDHDRDQRFGLTEMRSEFGLVVSRARPQFVTTVRQNAAAMAGVPRMPRTTAGTAGPTWFRKMDRNQDGDVAWREFLGPRADFDRIDTDQNSLIDLNEATAVE